MLRDRKKEEKRTQKLKDKEEKRLLKEQKKAMKKGGKGGGIGGPSGVLSAAGIGGRAGGGGTAPAFVSAVAEVEAALHSGGEGGGDFVLVDNCLNRHSDSLDPYVLAAFPRLMEMREEMIGQAKRELQGAAEWDDPESIRAHAQHISTVFGVALMGNEMAVLGQRCKDLNDQAALRMHNLLGSTFYPEIASALIEYEGFDDGEAAVAWEQLFQHKRRLQDQVNAEIIAVRESVDVQAVTRLLEACVPFGDQVDATSREQLEQRLLYLIRAPSLDQGVGGESAVSLLASRGMTTHEARMAQHNAAEGFHNSEFNDGTVRPLEHGTTHVDVEEFNEVYAKLKFSIAERRPLEAALQQARAAEWAGIVEQRRLRSELRQGGLQNEQMRRLLERKLSKLGLPASVELRELQEGTGDVAAVARSLSMPMERQLAQTRAEAHRAVRHAVTSTERRLGAQYSAREATLRAELASLAAALEDSKAALARQRVDGHGVAAAAHAEEQQAAAEESPRSGDGTSRARSPGRRSKSRSKGGSKSARGVGGAPGGGGTASGREHSEEVIHRLLESEKRLREELWAGSPPTGRSPTGAGGGRGSSPRGYSHAEEMSAAVELKQALVDVTHWQSLYTDVTTQLKAANTSIEAQNSDQAQFTELVSINDELVEECAKLHKEIDDLHTRVAAAAFAAPLRGKENAVAASMQQPLPAAPPSVAPRPSMQQQQQQQQQQSPRMQPRMQVIQAASYMQRQAMPQQQSMQQTQMRPSARSPQQTRPRTPPKPAGAADVPPPVAPRPSPRPQATTSASSSGSHAWSQVRTFSNASSAMGVYRPQGTHQQHQLGRQMIRPTASAPIPTSSQNLDFGEMEEPLPSMIMPMSSMSPPQRSPVPNAAAAGGGSSWQGVAKRLDVTSSSMRAGLPPQQQHGGYN